MKHINIPIFIPHLGCPNQCVFCDQRTISGTVSFDEGRVSKIIEDVLATSRGAECEIAFFGGSFTGIDRPLMIRLLDTAERYAGTGLVVGIRMSTRPDYIDKETVEILKNYTVTQVELGIQSMSDSVLSASKRGHTADDTRKAVSLLVNNGFETVGQMMVGLPGSTPDDETATAEEICDMGCVAARIYPTIVFKDTELDDMTKRGEYTPLSVDEAAERSAAALEIFADRGVRCIRIGLCDSENLHSEDTYSCGPSHPAMGEIVSGKLFYKKIRSKVLSLISSGAKTAGKVMVVECPAGAVSKVIGNRRCNEKLFTEEFKIKSIKTIEKESFIGYNIKVSFI